MKKFFILVFCCLWAIVSIAQSDKKFNEWKQKAVAKGNSWSNFTRAATAESNRTYYSLSVDGQFVASFVNRHDCDTKELELYRLAEQIFNSNTDKKSNSYQGSAKAREGLHKFGGMSYAEIDQMRKQIEDKRDEAINKQRAKENKKLLADVKKSCDCRSETNQNYDPDAKPYDFGNNDLFKKDDKPDNNLNTMLFGDGQTQYDNVSDALAATKAGTATTTSNVPSVNLDFSGMDEFVSKGSNEIYVGDVNWKAPIIRVQPVELEGAYSLNKLDAFKKEIDVDMKFRNEVAESIRSFLENKTGSIPQLMRNLYKERTGYDIEELRNKKYLTEEERKIVEDYNHFVKQMSIELDYQANEAKKKPNPEKNLVDFAIMANDVYKDDDYTGLKDSDWKPLMSSHSVDDKAIAQAIDVINKFNDEGSGFYAQIYKNEFTGEYTLAFRGTEALSIKDWYNNFVAGSSIIPSEQYANASMIGELLSGSNAKINIVGHSLGGGLATVAGLKTGFPTYTYNQADISQGTIDSYKLDVSKSDNITAYYMEGEILTTLQNETRDYNTLVPLGKKVKTGSVITEESAVLTAVSKTAQVVNDTRAKIIGGFATAFDKGDNLVAMADGHKMPNTEQYFRSIYSKSQAKWEGYNNVQLVLKNDKTYSNLLIKMK